MDSLTRIAFCAAKPIFSNMCAADKEFIIRLFPEWWEPVPQYEELLKIHKDLDKHFFRGEFDISHIELSAASLFRNGIRVIPSRSADLLKRLWDIYSVREIENYTERFDIPALNVLTLEEYLSMTMPSNDV